jgi:spoIIIJ-associated protein
MADRAIADQRVFKLGPLDPRARRVVHMTLKDVAGVTTKSEGEGVFRRVCIIPKGAETGDAEATNGGSDE